MIDSGSEINVIHAAYTIKLDLFIRKMDLGIQKINKSHLDSFKMVIAAYSVKDKLERVQFFLKPFLLADICLEVVLGIFFLTFSKANTRFTIRKLVWTIYMAVEALLTTRRIQIINKKKFAVVVLNADKKTFVMHVTTLAG